MKRWFVSIVSAAACCFGVWEAARTGFARTSAQNAALMNDRAAAERGVRWLSNDPATHTSRGIVLQRAGEYTGAVAEFERAAQLRPRDYFPWMLLGVTRDLNGDQTGAVLALRQAIALAPEYGKPHWLLGNLLLRNRQNDEAFRELRFAAHSDPALLPNVIDLAWGISRRDPAQTMAAIQPQTDSVRLALALFFASHREGAAALDQFRAVTRFSEESANQLLAELLKAGQFVQAYDVWMRTHGVPNVTPALINGDFEDEVAVGRTGFGWQIPSELSNVTMSVDGSQYQTGARSLRVDFRGNTELSKPLLSQVVIVKPNTKYRLSFQAMTRDLVSAAPPVIAVTDAAEETQQPIARSSEIARPPAWQPYVIEFASAANTQAILVALTRQMCPAQPCAAFGTLWLDSFRLEAITAR